MLRILNKMLIHLSYSIIPIYVKAIWYKMLHVILDLFYFSFAWNDDGKAENKIYNHQIQKTLSVWIYLDSWILYLSYFCNRALEKIDIPRNYGYQRMNSLAFHQIIRVNKLDNYTMWFSCIYFSFLRMNQQISV